MSTSVALLLCLAVAAPTTAPSATMPDADPAPRTVVPEPLRLDPFVDTAASLGLFVVLGGTVLARKQRPFAAQCSASGPDRCDPSDLYAVDRYAVGKRSDAWLLASDIAQYGGLLLPFLVDGIDVALTDGAGLGTWGTDAVVILEAELAAGLVVHALKLSTNRPRPRQYDPQRYKAVSGSQDSFASGHAAATVTGLTALATTWWWRHPDSPSRYWLVGAVAVYAVVGSWARVEAGQHFPSDVLTGAALGVLAGTLIPWLHRVGGDWQTQVVPMLGEQPGAALVVRY